MIGKFRAPVFALSALAVAEKRAPKPQLRLIGKLRDAGGMRATNGDARTPLELEGKVPDSRQKSAKICENPGGFALLLKKGS